MDNAISQNDQPDNQRNKVGGTSEVKLDHLKVTAWLDSVSLISEELNQNPHHLELLSSPALLLSKIEEFLDAAEADEVCQDRELIDRAKSVADLKEEVKSAKTSLAEKWDHLHYLSEAVEHEKWEKFHIEAEIRSLQQSLESSFTKIGAICTGLEAKANPIPETEDSQIVENVCDEMRNKPQPTVAFKTENKELENLSKRINDWTHDVDTSIEQLSERSEERNREMREAQERISHIFEAIVQKKEQEQRQNARIEDPVQVESPQPGSSSTSPNTSVSNHEETNGDDIVVLAPTASSQKKARKFNIRIATSPLSK